MAITLKNRGTTVVIVIIKNAATAKPITARPAYIDVKKIH
jgi:hypothetical protein